MRIDVLPLRKLPNAVAILSYETTTTVQPGQLVTVPFRGRPMLGVVWDTNSNYQGAVQPVTKVLEQLVVNDIQLAVLKQLQTTHAVSVASLLTQHFPANRVLKSLVVSPVADPTPPTTHTVDWYTDRQQSIRDHVAAIRQRNELTCIVVPTLDHAHIWQQHVPEALLLTSDSSAKERNAVYTKTANGTARILIGTADLLFLPYPTWPVWIIDDEEHQSHKQSQAPYLDVRRALDHIPGQHLWLSPAPTIRRWKALRPKVPSVTTTRTIGRLDQGANAPWISWEAESAIRGLSDTDPILFLLPRKNFAIRLGCTNCGWSVACASCGSVIRWSQQSKGAARCGFCQQEQTIPSSCAQCHQPGVQAIGLNDQVLRQSLEKLFPGQTHRWHIRAYFDPLPETCSCVVHVSGDALLQFPDVAAEDRSYQLVQHIASRTPKAQQIIQTYDPSFRLWQLWSAQDDQTWYATIWQERLDLHLPPAQPAILARYRGPQPHDALIKKREELLALSEKNLHILQLPIRQKTATQTPSYRLLITCRDGANPTTRIDWRNYFPHPWAVDMAPDSWLV